MPVRRKEPPAPARVLSIHAHPDDQEFTVAGTLAKWARAGSRIVTVCLTNGEAGSNRHTKPTIRPSCSTSPVSSTTASLFRSGSI